MYLFPAVGKDFWTTRYDCGEPITVSQKFKLILGTSFEPVFTVKL